VWGGLVRVGQEMGTDVLLVQTQLPEGADDEDVLAFAANQKRVLLTSNAQDFAPLVTEWFLAGREHWGIIIVPGQTKRSLLSRAMKSIIQQYPADSLKNSYRFIQEFA
jgi:predicted nuclease of predicted toxin-antitoxin system